jgi:hypothetical protein
VFPPEHPANTTRAVTTTHWIRMPACLPPSQNPSRRMRGRLKIRGGLGWAVALRT